ncbi:MAG: hypothetical protein VKL59_20965 [Nostocaceae cyanobacterium]|nr:hypothetical protein [Nostocaceae cyanobacterium]
MQPARAEGSANLTNNGGDRPYLDYRIGTDDITFLTGGIPRRSTIRVFANPGETLNLGSSANGLGQGVINFRAPNGTPGSCPTTGVTGRIQNRAQEVAGPAPNALGYEPCIVTVGAGQGGIWEIDFVSPNPSSTIDPPPITANGNWAQPNNASYVSAWDVTVRNSGGQAIPGRAYANYLSLNMGGNGRSLSSTAFVQTNDGYQYSINLNGLDPYGFIFFANNKGFVDGSGNPLFRSVDLQQPFNLNRPNQPDTGTDITHKLFFQPPSTDLPTDAAINPGTSTGGTTWLLRPPTPPPAPTRFQFIGQEGIANQAGTTDPRGGNFIFDSSAQGSYSIIIDVNRDGTFGNGNDRVLLGKTIAGTNTVPWDGLDADGNTIPPNLIPYGVNISLSAGDVHFPIFDPENNPGGLIIQRLTPTPAGITPGPFDIFYDDLYSPAARTATGRPNPLSARAGVNSTGGARGFTSNFGDQKGIDTWTFFPSEGVALDGGILISEADLQIVKTLTTNPVIAGSPVTYTITVTNAGPSNARNARVVDPLPPELSGTTWTCAVTTGTGACATPSGTGSIDSTVNLNSGAVATFTITGGILPTATGNLSVNTATVNRPPDLTDPNPRNNTSSAGPAPILPNPVQPIGTKSVRIVNDADNSGTPTTGDTLEYTITYTNTSEVPVTDFLATDAIDTNALSFVNGTYRFTATGNGTTITGNDSFNGASDINLTNPTTRGTLVGQGGSVEIKYQAVITAAANTQIVNQASAESKGGTVNPSLTDAVSRPGDIPQLVDDGINRGNLPSTSDDEPNIVTVATLGEPRLRLVKRITSVTRDGATLPGVNFSSYVDTDSPDDNREVWQPAPLPVGVPNVGGDTNNIRSGDIVEYTIYFLSDGRSQANEIQMCDPLPQGTSFINDAFGAGNGILVNRVGQDTARTNVADTDEATFFGSLTPLPPNNACSNPTNAPEAGAVVVNLGNIPNTPGGNFGFVRFRVRVN